MDFFEAMKALEEGKRVRRRDWGKYHYIYLEKIEDEEVGYVLKDEDGDYFLHYIDLDNKWEVYDDREDCPKVLRDLWGF